MNEEHRQPHSSVDEELLSYFELMVRHLDRTHSELKTIKWLLVFLPLVWIAAGAGIFGALLMLISGH